jgi:hypothetical protein
MEQFLLEKNGVNYKFGTLWFDIKPGVINFGNYSMMGFHTVRNLNRLVGNNKSNVFEIYFNKG